MSRALSPRLREIVEALPLGPGLRVVEIGCGPGAMAVEIANRVGPAGHVLAVDRSATAIAQLTRAASDMIESGRVTARQVPVEELRLDAGEQRYDLAVAIRVGAFDGRHPELGTRALERLEQVVVPGGRLFIDGGSPVRSIEIR